MKHYKTIAAALWGIALCFPNTIWAQDIDVDVDDATPATESHFDVPESSVIDEVIWVVGDEAIYKSDVEAVRLQSEMEGVKWNGDPDCAIPEQLAVQKLFLHQAALDSIEISESDVISGVDEQINRWIQIAGSQEKLEEYRKQTVAEMRLSLHDEFKNNELVREMKQKLVKNVSVTPADVRRYFKDVPEDSIPFVPTEVEVQIITQQPRIAPEEINRIKDELRNYTERVNKQETTFATLARLYSEDTGTARQGGEFGYVGRGELDPAFAAVAFNLTDPKKISKIVESEFGFHIIQLIDRRGDRIKVRHILRKPQISRENMEESMARIDSIGEDLRNGLFTFEEAAFQLSDDKDTRNNRGIMSSVDSETGSLSSKIRMRDLPSEVARTVDTMKVGDISHAFTMINSRGKVVCAIVKLTNRIEAHKATIAEDYQVLREVVLNKRREEVIHNWVVDKIKHTYVQMDNRYKNCNFEYQGWIK